GVAGGEAAGAGGPGGVGGDVGEQVIEVGVHHALCVGGAVDLDVAAPQLRPGGGLIGQQRVEAARACGARQREIGGRVAAPAVARQRDVLGEHVGLALAHR